MPLLTKSRLALTLVLLFVLSAAPLAAQEAAPAAEEKTSFARTEFVAVQTGHGLLLGIEFCDVIQCGSNAVAISSLTVGAGAGLGLSLLASRDGVTPGFATIMNSGAYWGAFHGGFITSNLTENSSTISGVMGVSQLGAMGVSALIWNQWRPTAGEVSMTNSGGIWVAQLSALGFLAAGATNWEVEPVVWALIALTDVGLIGGALLSQIKPISRGRMLMIDLGGVLGMVAGMGTSALIAPSSEVAAGISGIAGTLAGLGIATVMTRNWDASDDARVTARWGIAPTEDGATLSLSGAF